MKKQKNDTELRRDILAELKWDPSVADAEIALAIKDGVVTLGGFVQTYAQKLAAERAVKRVEGVRAISEQIEVRLPSTFTRNDTDLAHRVVDALKWDVEVPDEKIKVKVENGWVTLEGQVDWHYQRDAAERAVRYLSGVKGISNAIALTPQVKEKDVASLISEALRRHAEREASRIKIVTDGGTVTLEGRVDSWAERSEIEQAAWSARGVTKVEDRLLVGL